MTTVFSVTPGQVNPHLPPTPDVVAHRGQVRDLWKELTRIAANSHGRDFWYSDSDGLSLQTAMLLRSTRPFIASVDADLNAVRKPYQDADLAELHGFMVERFVVSNVGDFRVRPQRGRRPQAVLPLPGRFPWSSAKHRLRRVTTAGHNTEVLSTLLAIDGVLPLLSGTGLDLLEGALQGGSLEVMPALLAVDSILSQVSGVHDGRKILPWTVERGDRSMVGALIKAGAPLECRARLGNPPLTGSVECDRDEALGIARDLLDAGADANNNNAEYILLAYNWRNYGNTRL